VANTQLTGTITGSQISSNTLSNTVFQTGSVENYMRGANLDFGMRNRIINGAMVIDQRNAGASVTLSADTYILDRYKSLATQASKLSVQQNAGSVTPPAGFINYMGFTSLSAYSIGAGDIFGFDQRIEGLNATDLAWGTASASPVTLSFWVRSSLTGTFGGSLENSAGTRSYPFTYTISSANTWEYETITIVGDTSGTWLTTSGIGIRVQFGLGVGSTYSGTAGAWAGANYLSATGATSVVGTNGATFYITGVQLEKGSTATSFDYRPYGTEFSLCQRYFQIVRNGIALGNSASIVVTSSMLTPTMRASPSLSQQGVIQITNGTTDFVQSSTSTTLASGSDNCIVYTLGNFSGLTSNAAYGFRIGANTNGVTASAEL